MLVWSKSLVILAWADPFPPINGILNDRWLERRDGKELLVLPASGNEPQGPVSGQTRQKDTLTTPRVINRHVGRNQVSSELGVSDERG
jgi:hypothetical protein